MYLIFKKHIKKMLSHTSHFFTHIWHNFYFHWQLKDKTGYLLLSAFIFVLIAVPSLTYQLVKYKNIQHDIKCLTLNIFHEARSESEAGQRAVASVTLNRVASKHYPNNICDVVYQRNWDKIRKRYVGQFSWTEFDEPPKLKSKAWYRAWKIAEKAYKEKDKRQLKGALFYHAKRIKPSWARKKKPIAIIGSHIFYR
jgi:spore germination cell wall hydrolase CwlJ-like protein